MEQVSDLHRYIGHGNNRIKNDFYRTPEHATRALLANVAFNGFIWECACGDGAISKILKETGYDVGSTDLYDHGYGDSPIDFLSSFGSVPNIVTNPPFNRATEFALHALLVATDKIALFGKLTFLEGKKRSRELFSQKKLKYVYVFSERVGFEKNGGASAGGMLAFAWYIWEQSYYGQPEIFWI
jgi:hypothetical protein